MTEETKEETKPQTLQEYHRWIETNLNNFAKDFTAGLPSSKDTVVMANIVTGDLLAVKEKSKLLVNNFFYGKAQDES